MFNRVSEKYFGLSMVDRDGFSGEHYLLNNGVENRRTADGAVAEGEDTPAHQNAGCGRGSHLHGHGARGITAGNDGLRIIRSRWGRGGRWRFAEVRIWQTDRTNPRASHPQPPATHTEWARDATAMECMDVRVSNSRGGGGPAWGDPRFSAYEHPIYTHGTIDDACVRGRGAIIAALKLICGPFHSIPYQSASSGCVSGMCWIANLQQKCPRRVPRRRRKHDDQGVRVPAQPRPRSATGALIRAFALSSIVVVSSVNEYSDHGKPDFVLWMRLQTRYTKVFRAVNIVWVCVSDPISSSILLPPSPCPEYFLVPLYSTVCAPLTVTPMSSPIHAVDEKGKKMDGELVQENRTEIWPRLGLVAQIAAVTGGNTASVPSHRGYSSVSDTTASGRQSLLTPFLNALHLCWRLARNAVNRWPRSSPVTTLSTIWRLIDSAATTMSSGPRTLVGGSLKVLQDLSSGSNIPALEPLVNVAVRIYTVAVGTRNNKRRVTELTEDLGNSVKQILQVCPKEANSVAGCTPDLHHDGVRQFQRQSLFSCPFKTAFELGQNLGRCSPSIRDPTFWEHLQIFIFLVQRLWRYEYL
ncbi:hypothetical protein DFH09DRAFT_1102927 [Mycena vulgaris]|nr:hypothetical protein DFH09DRAFT_1102927 [Mycena vulgaris]